MKQCQTFCSKQIDNPAHSLKAASVIALSNGLELPEIWNSQWTSHSVELARILTLTGVFVSGLDVNRIIKASPITAIRRISTGGRKFVNQFHHSFAGVANILIQMLHHGCSRAEVQLDLSVLFPVISSVLTLNINVDNNKAQAAIENDFGFSQQDMHSLSIPLKVSCTGLLHALLCSGHPGLLKVSSLCYNSLCSSYAINSIMTSSHQLHLLTTQTLQQCIHRFPSCVNKPAFAAAMVTLLERFQRQVELVATSRTSVAAEATSMINQHENIENTNKNTKKKNQGVNNNNSNNVVKEETLSSEQISLLTAVFQTCESLLLFSGPYLSIALRDQLELSIGQVICCVSKGVAPRTLPDRKLRRYNFEWVRQLPELQSLALSVATAEIQTPRCDGLYSGNIVAVQRAAQVCLHQSNNAVVAARALLTVESLLHPVNLSLPATAGTAMANKMLVERQKQRDEDAEEDSIAVGVPASHAAELEASVKAEVHQEDNKITNNKRQLDGKQESTMEMIQKKNKIQEDNQPTAASVSKPLNVNYSFESKNKKEANNASSDGSKPLSTVSDSSNKRKHSNNNNKESDSDEDDELPDIEF